MGNKRKKISLVLGSGGARGHAHIGVIRAIEERGLQICNIAGTSVGSLIGGVYASGHLDTYQDWAYRLEKKDVVKLLDFSFTRKSIFKGERVFKVLQDLIGDRKIEDLDIGFTAVATNLEEQREVWLNSGSLFRAIRASSAVPGVFSPVELHGQTLVDGGLVNPIPIAPTLNDSTDLTLAVNLNSMSGHHAPPGEEKPARESKENEPYREKIARFISEFLSAGDNEDAVPDVTEAVTLSIDIMQGAIARLKLAAYTPDKIIRIPRQACSFFEFHRAEEMAQLGYKNTCTALDELDL